MMSVQYPSLHSLVNILIDSSDVPGHFLNPCFFKNLPSPTSPGFRIWTSLILRTTYSINMTDTTRVFNKYIKKLRSFVIDDLLRSFSFVTCNVFKEKNLCANPRQSNTDCFFNFTYTG